MTEEEQTVICYNCKYEFEVSAVIFESGMVVCPHCRTKNEVILG